MSYKSTLKYSLVFLSSFCISSVIADELADVMTARSDCDGDAWTERTAARAANYTNLLADQAANEETVYGSCRVRCSFQTVEPQ